MGMKVARVMSSPKTVLLEMEGPENMGILKTKYENHQAEVNVHSLKTQLKEVKDIVFPVMRRARENGMSEQFSMV